MCADVSAPSSRAFPAAAPPPPTPVSTAGEDYAPAIVGQKTHGGLDDGVCSLALDTEQQQPTDMPVGYDSVLTTRPGASSAADRQAMLGAGHDIYTEQQQDTGTGTGVEYGSVLTRKGSVYAGFDVTDNVGTSTA